MSDFFIYPLVQFVLYSKIQNIVNYNIKQGVGVYVFETNERFKRRP